jgi:hypothetical protein
MNQAQLIKSSKLIAQRMGIDQGAALNMLKKKIGEEDPREKSARDKYGVPDYTANDDKFLRNSELIAAKKNIPLEQAQQLLQSRMEELSLQKNSEAEEIAKDLTVGMNDRENESKGGFQKLAEYGAETLKDPFSRAAQIGSTAVASVPGLADTASSIGRSMIDIGMPQSYEEHDITGTQPNVTIDENVKPESYYRNTKKYLMDKGRNVGIKPEESTYAKKANNVAAVVPEMVLFRGAGKGLELAASGAEKAAKLAKLSQVAKIPVAATNKAAKFLKSGSDVTKANELLPNVGASLLPAVLDTENPGASILASLAGAYTGRKWADLKNNLSKEGRAVWKGDIPSASDSQRQVDLYKSQNVPINAYNVSKNAGTAVVTKGLQTSTFGGNVKKAMEAQEDAVSKGITPTYNENFDKSTFGEKIIPIYKKNLNDMWEDITKDFNKVEESFEKHTDGIVPLKEVKGHIKKVLSKISDHPGHLELFMDTPAFVFLDKIAGPFVQQEVDKILSNQMQSDYLTEAQKETLQKKRRAPREQVKIGDQTIGEMDPTLWALIQQKIGGDIDNNEILNKALNVPYGFLKGALEKMNTIIPSNDQISDSYTGAVEHLMGTILKDIEGSVGTQLKTKSPADYKHYRQTFDDYTKFAKRDKRQHNEILKLIDDPIAFVKKIVSSGVSSDGTKVRFLTEGMNPEQHVEFQNSMNRILGSAGMENNRKFDPSIWARRYEGLDIQSKQAIYGDEKSIEKYNALADIVKDMQRVHTFGNTSHSGTQVMGAVDMAILFKAFVGTIGGAVTGDISTIAAALSPLLAKMGGSRLLTSEKYKNLLVKMENAKTKKQLVDTLKGVKPFTKGQAMNSMLKNIQKVLSIGD